MTELRSEKENLGKQLNHGSRIEDDFQKLTRELTEVTNELNEAKTNS
jgi:hypothetical protein